MDSVQIEESAKLETDECNGRFEGLTERCYSNSERIFSVETLIEEEEEFTATLGAVHQAVLDNNILKVREGNTKVGTRSDFL